MLTNIWERIHIKEQQLGREPWRGSFLSAEMPTRERATSLHELGFTAHV